VDEKFEPATPGGRCPRPAEAGPPGAWYDQVLPALGAVLGAKLCWLITLGVFKIVFGEVSPAVAWGIPFGSAVETPRFGLIRSTGS
jgi:hypothetical protein